MKDLKNIINILLNIIYPKKCIFCQEIIPVIESEFICKHCEMDIDYIFLDKAPFLAVFEYNDKTKYAIHRFKYYNRPDYAKYFAKMMYLKFQKINDTKYDYVIYAPMYFKKKKKRGYDQAELLAIEFSKLTNIKLLRNNLIRNRNTIAQSKVTYEERKSNVEGAFSVINKDLFKNKNILIIDDIYTTGNTLLQCAKEVKNCGAENICFFTLAKVYVEKD